jgi:quercetin dioxygenase-like cupin family protein
MGSIKSSEVKPEAIAQSRSRYLAYTDHLMMVIFDCHDGPASQPDPLHSHPHEQISYVVTGEINLILGDEITRLGPGDMFWIPPNIPHAIQTLTEHVRLVDTFTPIRKDFLK